MAKTPKLVSLPAAEALVKPLDEDNAAELHTASTPTDAELDADEQEFNALRRDLPGVKGVVPPASSPNPAPARSP